MKNIIIASFLMLAPVGVTAQYQKAQEKAPLVNVPLENFASQQKVLFNFGWKFQPPKIPKNHYRLAQYLNRFEVLCKYFANLAEF